ncbi:spore-associated protein [Kitasatospora sp. NPDC008050]|uniref:spore-associated protein n=1 Tax=Kitasatospora sp. NPDC008050 TaxID=3364021 RepID=UPI0036EBA121
MSRRFKAIAAAASAVAALTVPIALASPASATANNGATAAAICGSGYWNIDSQNINSSTVYLSYNGSTDCVVTIKDPDWQGSPDYVWATVNTDGSQTTNEDGGQFSYYAGPSRVYAPGQCIYWGGGDYYNSSGMIGPVHCN